MSEVNFTKNGPDESSQAIIQNVDSGVTSVQYERNSDLKVKTKSEIEFKKFTPLKLQNDSEKNMGMESFDFNEDQQMSHYDKHHKMIYSDYSNSIQESTPTHF